jgi:UDP-glucose 4-epimerase
MADGGDGRNQSPYAWTKAVNTELVQRYGEWFGLDFCITYFYNVYGGREVGTGPYATLIAIWKNKVKNGEKLGVVSPGTQMRSFTHISDIVSGLILAGEKGMGDGYALGPKEMFTIMDVAKIFTRGDMRKIEMLKELPGDRKTVSIDLSKTEEDLGWEAKVKLREHLENFLQENNL